jgi:hypothetical protein
MCCGATCPSSDMRVLVSARFKCNILNLASDPCELELAIECQCNIHDLILRPRPYMKKDLVHFVALAVLISMSRVHAQSPAPAAQAGANSRPMPTSNYCLPVSAAFLESEAKASDQMKKCSRGDTIVVPARSAGAVARMCDFSKAIVAVGDNVVCAMVFPERPSR